MMARLMSHFHSDNSKEVNCKRQREE